MFWLVSAVVLGVVNLCLLVVLSAIVMRLVESMQEMDSAVRDITRELTDRIPARSGLTEP